MTDRAVRTTMLATLALFVGACGGDADPQAAADAAPDADAFCSPALAAVESYLEAASAEMSAPTGPRYGGTVVVAAIADMPGGMNSLAPSDYIANQHQTFAHLMTLIRYDEQLQAAPYLAESWEVAADHSSVTFHLRRDVVWHDGNPTNAYDVAFTYLRASDPETAFPNAAFWDHYVTGPEGVEVVDSFTVTLRMAPHADFLDPWRTMAILPRHLLEDVPPAELAQHPFGTQCPVGNGPFVYVSHRPQESWTFRANPVFPEPLGGRPYVDRYVYRVIPEPATLLTELFSGTIDLYLQPTPDQTQAILDNPDTELNHFFFRDFVFVGWNARKPQLADARVRRAITMGTDRQTIVEALLKGYGEVAYSSVPPFHYAHDPGLAGDLGYDPQAAAALLDEAGWTDRDGDGVRENADGLPLSISVLYNTGNQLRQGIAELMQAQLREIGVDVRPEVAEFSNIIARIMDPVERDFDGVVMGWVPEFKVDDSDLFHSDRIDQLYAWAGTRNPAIDRLLDTLQLVVERADARPLWLDYQRLVAEEQPYTFFYYPQRLEGVRTRLRDVVADSRGEWINVGEWWLDPADRREN